MPDTTYKTRSVELGNFHGYLEKKIQELERCEESLNQARTRLTEEFKAVMASWQELYGYCYPTLTQMRHEVPADFEERIDRIETEELKKISQEIADLQQEITEKRARSDELLGLAQGEVEQMRKQNPEIDEREEALKAQVVKYQDDYADAYEEIDRLSHGAFGWLTNAGSLRAQKKRQKQARKQQEKALEKLRQVRQEWLTKVESAADTQSELREEWQTVGVRLAEAETRLEYLTSNTEKLGEQNAIKRILDEMTTSPQVDGELGEKLAAFAQQNVLRKQYERGVSAAAEFTGYTRGVVKGVRTFDSSVAKVITEQKRYSLSRVELVIQESAQEMLDIWYNVRSELSKNKGFSQHPADLADLLEPIIKTQLTNEKIADLFESMGKALNRGTAVWG